MWVLWLAPPVLVFVVFWLVLWAIGRSRRIVYLNAVAAQAGRVSQRRLPRAYRDLATFFGSGLIDRTGTLDMGFRCAVRDPIPPIGRSDLAIDEICDARGAALFEEARSTGRELHVLWSGGIDSTTALVALLRAAQGEVDLRRILVRYGPTAIQEYARFHVEHIDGVLRHEVIDGPIGEALDPSALIVTGELGDQIFGSVLAERYMRSGEAFEPWESVFPALLADELGSKRRAERVLRWLRPQIATAPCAIETLFDLLWWLSFSMKWQIVDLRLAVACGPKAREVHAAMRHFFADPAFQEWSISHTDQRIGRTWESYKWPLKSYIRDFTGDEDYFRSKVKEMSLQKLNGPTSAPPQPVAMMETFGVLTGIGVGLGLVAASESEARWSLSVTVE